MSLPKHGILRPLQKVSDAEVPMQRFLKGTGCLRQSLQQSRELHSVSGQKRVFTVTQRALRKQDFPAQGGTFEEEK